MKVSIILAHPDKNSFNAAIAKCCRKTLAANGHTVFFHDLYAEKFNALLPAKEIPRTAKLSDELKRHCDEISSADGIIVVHPNWWGQCSAYLKDKTPFNSNSLMNITFVSDHLNKRKIGSKSPATYIGNEYSTHIKINFPKYDHQTICHVKIVKSSNPIFIAFEGREDFFVRSGCSSQPLSREAQSIYEKEHWD